MDFIINNGVLEKYTGDYENVTEIVVPNGVKTIGYKAFKRCINLVSVELPKGLVAIDEEAFYKCYSLTSITIPEGVKSIGDRAFSNCERLSSVTIPKSVSEIGTSAFSSTRWINIFTEDIIINKIYLKHRGKENDVVIPEGITTIADNVFYNFKSITSITIPKSVKSIGSRAF